MRLYKVHYGIGSREYTNVLSAGSSLILTVSNLVRGATYYFAATAVDTGGLESDFSNEVSYTVPSLPAPPLLKQWVVLTVQIKPPDADAQWADSGMDWSLSPDEASQFFRLKIAMRGPPVQ